MAYSLKSRPEWSSQSLETLDALEGLGLTEDRFIRLHHFSQPGSRSSTNIASHRRYCEDTALFHSRGTNLDVLHRLLLVRYLLDEKVDWERAIAAALAAFPFE